MQLITKAFTGVQAGAVGKFQCRNLFATFAFDVIELERCSASAKYEQGAGGREDCAWPGIV